MANIKDYIGIEYNNVGDKKSRSNPSIPEYKYTLVLENNTDFVINRKTKSSDKDLAFIVSQGLFYIKDNKKKTNTPLTNSMLREFIKNEFKIDFEKNVWMKRLKFWQIKDELKSLLENKNKAEMYKNGIFDITNNNDIKRFGKDKALFKIFAECTKKNMNSYLFELMEEVKDEFGYDKVYLLRDELDKSNVNFGFMSNYQSYNYKNNEYGMNFFKKLKDYNIDFDRFLEYMLKDSYQQGVIDIAGSNFATSYFDTMRMQKELYGKVKEKYPKNLKTFHDIISLKYNQYKKYYKENTVFDTMLLEQFEKEYKDYTFICAKKGLDLIEEGISLNHCVGSYVDGVAEGKYNIFFMRNTETPEESLITIQLNGNRIVQYSGYSNRSLDKNEKMALKKWTKDNKFECEGI